MIPAHVNKVVIQKGEDCPNAAYEASSFLKYIIDNYNQLSDIVFFIHDEDWSWHHSGSLTDRFSEFIYEFQKLGEGYYEINDMALDFDSDMESLVQSLACVLTHDPYCV